MTSRRTSEFHAGAWLALTGLVLVISGCGGSEATQPTTPTTLASSSSPAIARADAICRHLNEELTAKPPKKASVQEIERVSPRNAALEQRAVAELSKLVPPASIAREWQQVIAYRHRLAQELLVLARTARSGDAADIKRLARSKASVRKKLLATGKRIGFNDCQEVG